MAFAGGREAVARMALMTIGVAVGVVLLLLSLTALPVMQRHIDRLAWHRTDAASPATAPDPALWLAVTDRYAGRDVIRVHVAALGERPPVPPGVDRLPGAGRGGGVAGARRADRGVPDDQLRDRFPGGSSARSALTASSCPTSSWASSGTPRSRCAPPTARSEIRGIEQPGERLDLFAVLGVLFGMLAALIIGPVAVFVSMAARVGGVRREQRFAALRLAGATRLQTAALAATETAGAALAGIAVGCAGLRRAPAGRREAASRWATACRSSRRTSGCRWRRSVIALTAVFVLAVGTALVTLTAVQSGRSACSGAAGAGHRGRWRLLPLAFGILGTWYSADLEQRPGPGATRVRGLLAAVALSDGAGRLLPGRRVGCATGPPVAWPGSAAARPR